MYKYQAQVKVSGVWVKTIIYADNQLHAKLLAQYQYGTTNVPFAPIKIGKNMRFFEFAGAVKKPLTPDQARIKSMQDQVKKSQKAVKAERARQKIKAGQKALSQL